MSSAVFPLIGLARHRLGTDGEGITTLVAAAGCPLRCHWCINRELLCKAFIPRNYLAQVIDAVDLFVVDCKDMNENIYRKYTGEDCAVMEENLRYLLERKDPDSILVRVPLIPGFNTAQDQKRSEKKLREMGVKRLDLFAYRASE